MFNKRILSMQIASQSIFWLTSSKKCPCNGVVDFWFVGVYLLSRVIVFSRVSTLIRYIEVHLMFGPPDYVRYIEEFVIQRFVMSRFYSIHFTAFLVGTQKIVLYIEEFAIQRFVISRFDCTSVLITELADYLTCSQMQQKRMPLLYKRFYFIGARFDQNRNP